MKKIKNLLLLIIGLLVCTSCNNSNSSDISSNNSSSNISIESKNLSYELSNDEKGYIVTGIGNCEDIKIVIPSTYNNYPVIGISDNAFYHCYFLTSIVIPDSVIYIGSCAFSDCSLLTSIVIPNSVTSIGDFAFNGCSSLTSINIPDSVTYIGKRAFGSGDALQYNEYGNCLYLGNDTNPYLVLVRAKDSSITSAVVHNNTKVIMNNAFNGCSSLESVNIGNNVISIGCGAFFNCTSLTSIVIPNSVNSIGSSAFRGCNSLTIYCERNERGWDSFWNGDAQAVYWANQWEYVDGIPTPKE